MKSHVHEGKSWSLSAPVCPLETPNNAGVSGWLSVTRPVVGVIDLSLVSCRMSASYQPRSDPSCSIKSLRSVPSRCLIFTLFPPGAKDFLCLLCDLLRSLTPLGNAACFYLHLLFPEETCKELSGGVAWVWLQPVLLLFGHAGWKETPPLYATRCHTKQKSSLPSGRTHKRAG